MLTVQNKIIERLELKIVQLEKELVASNTEKDKLQLKFSNYIANVKIASEKWSYSV